MLSGAFSSEPPRSTQAPLAFVPARYLSWRIGLRATFDAPPPANVVRETALKPSVLGDNAPSCWVHLTLYGEWQGHSAGPFAFNGDVFGRILDNFDAQKNTVSWTYEHPEKWMGTPIPSAGRTRQLQVRGDGSKDTDGLWGLVEWTPKAAEMIRGGEYKYCSVVVDLEGIDRVTNEPVGCVLFEVGLTDTPFIDGQQPITLSRTPRATETHMSKDKMKALLALAKKTGTTADALQSVMDEVAAALDMDASDTDEIVARVKAIADAIKALSPKAPPPALVDDAAKMSAEDRKRWVALLGAYHTLLRKFADTEDPAAMAATDGTGAVSGTEDQTTGGGGTTTDPDGDAAVDAALASVLSAAGMTGPEFAQWLGSADNAGALVSLLTGGGAPAEMSRQVGTLKLALTAKSDEATKLATEVKTLKDAAAAHEAEAVAKKLGDERDALIKAKREDGSITTDAVEADVRDIFAKLGHEAGKRSLGLLTPQVPTGGITDAARIKAGGAATPPPSPRTEDELALQGAEGSTQRETEKAIIAAAASPSAALLRLRIYRASVAAFPPDASQS